MDMQKKSFINILNDEDVAVIEFEVASITKAEQIASISDQIKEFVEVNHPAKIIVDFEQVKFFSSQVLGLLLDIRSRLKAYDGQVVISAIDPQLYRVFKITNLNKIFVFFPDRESATAAFRTN